MRRTNFLTTRFAKIHPNYEDPPNDQALALSLFHKCYVFLVHQSEQIRQFPKKDRHGLGLRIENNMFDLFTLLLRANKERGYKRLTTLREVDIMLDLQKILVRLAKDTKALPEKQYIVLQSELNEIGRMLGGWMRKLGTQNSA